MSSLDRALIHVCQIWTERFCAPLQHPGLIDADLLREGMVRATQVPTTSVQKSEETKVNVHATAPRSQPLVESSPSQEPEPEPEPPKQNNVNEKENTSASSVPLSRCAAEIKRSALYIPNARSNESSYTQLMDLTSVGVEPASQQCRQVICFAYPTPEPPASVVPSTDRIASDDPFTILDAVPVNARDAESFIATAELERAAELNRIVERRSITEWPMADRPSICGTNRVKGDPVLDAQIQRANRSRRLDFYLGPGTRRDAAF